MSSKNLLVGQSIGIEGLQTLIEQGNKIMVDRRIVEPHWRSYQPVPVRDTHKLSNRGIWDVKLVEILRQNNGDFAYVFTDPRADFEKETRRKNKKMPVANPAAAKYDLMLKPLIRWYAKHSDKVSDLFYDPNALKNERSAMVKALRACPIDQDEGLGQVLRHYFSNSINKQVLEEVLEKTAVTSVLAQYAINGFGLDAKKQKLADQLVGKDCKHVREDERNKADKYFPVIVAGALLQNVGETVYDEGGRTHQKKGVNLVLEHLGDRGAIPSMVRFMVDDHENHYNPEFWNGKYIGTRLVAIGNELHSICSDPETNIGRYVGEKNGYADILLEIFAERADPGRIRRAMDTVRVGLKRVYEAQEKIKENMRRVVKNN